MSEFLKLRRYSFNQDRFSYGDVFSSACGRCVVKNRRDLSRKNRRNSFSVLNNIIRESRMEAEKQELVMNENLVESDEVKNDEESIEFKRLQENHEKDDTNETSERAIESDANFECLTVLRRNHHKNKKYAQKKHYSDFQITKKYLDSNDGECSYRRRLSQNVDEGTFREMDKETKSFKNYSKSDSNLSSDILNVELSTLPPNGRIKKSSSHRDITETQVYKDIYANNLRQYGFLLAKQLGTSNKSPDQLRKTYLENRLKAAERRERANSEERKKSNAESSSANRKYSTASLSQSGMLEHSKYSNSLTDISVVGLANDTILRDNTKRPQSASIAKRRKNKQHYRDMTPKRLSAPLLHTVKLEINVDHVEITAAPSPLKSRSLTSLNVPDGMYSSESDSDSKSSSTNEIQQSRKLSDETKKRQNEAQEKFQKRQSRLESFDDILSRANTLMKTLQKRPVDSTSDSEKQSSNITAVE